MHCDDNTCMLCIRVCMYVCTYVHTYILQVFVAIKTNKKKHDMGLGNSQHEIALLQVRKRRSSFTSVHPAAEIIAKMEETAKPLGFNVKKQDFKVRATFAPSFTMFTIKYSALYFYGITYIITCAHLSSCFLLPLLSAGCKCVRNLLSKILIE